MRLVFFCCPLLFLLSGCSWLSHDATVRKTISKSAVAFFNRSLNFDAPPLDAFTGWAYYAANAGGLLIIAGIICLIWLMNKRIGWRLICNGVIFGMVAKCMEFLGDHMGVLVLLCFPIGLAFHLPMVEKILRRMGWSVDLNRDGVIGTDTTIFYSEKIENIIDQETERMTKERELERDNDAT